MPFGPIPFNKKLGIANGSMPDAAGFANVVLRLTGLIPVYQGQLVHSVNWDGSGVATEAEWCGSADATSYGQTGYVRQISGNDTKYARRNLQDAQIPANALLGTSGHSLNTSNQVYYFGNEPETYSANIAPDGCSTAWGARNNIIDSYFTNPPAIFPNPIPPPQSDSFWEQSGAEYRTKADALAYSFLTIRNRLALSPYASHAHTVLPPSAISIVGFGRPDYAGPYWTTFFSNVKQGFTSFANGGAQTGITNLSDLKVLHAHYYDTELRDWLNFGCFPLAGCLPPDVPVTSVAKLAVGMRRAADWLREVYGVPSTSAIPIDIYLSESGPDWRIEAVNHPLLPCYWAGGWPDFQMGLSWWNTWLLWLTRNAGSNCNLQGWNTGAHTVHAGIHESMQPPYVTKEPSGSFWSLGNFRNQVYFNCDNAVWTTGVVYNAETINSPGLAESGRFKRSFSSFYETPWDYPAGFPYKFWRSGPFAACYKVWSEIGNDPDPAAFGSGWYSNVNAGVVGTYSIAIPAGYSTIYFPLMKSALGANIYPASTQISLAWLKQDANGNTLSTNYHGYMLASEISDSKSFIDINPWLVSPSPHYNQNIYASMVFPAVCYSTTAKTIKIRLERNVSGPELRFGRPIVLPYACSWFYSQ